MRCGEGRGGLTIWGLGEVRLKLMVVGLFVSDAESNFEDEKPYGS